MSATVLVRKLESIIKQTCSHWKSDYLTKSNHGTHFYDEPKNVIDIVKQFFSLGF